MNRQRRKWLQDTIEAIENAKIELESIRDEEDECWSNMPDSLQDSDKCIEMQENVDSMESAISSIDEAIEYITEVLDL